MRFQAEPKQNGRTKTQNELQRTRQSITLKTKNTLMIQTKHTGNPILTSLKNIEGNCMNIIGTDCLLQVSVDVVVPTLPHTKKDISKLSNTKTISNNLKILHIQS